MTVLNIACRPRSNGNTRHAPAQRLSTAEREIWMIWGGMPRIPDLRRVRWARNRQMASAYTICMEMFGRGARIEMVLIQTVTRRTRRGQRAVNPGSCAAVRGATMPTSPGPRTASGPRRRNVSTSSAFVSRLGSVTLRSLLPSYSSFFLSPDFFGLSPRMDLQPSPLTPVLSPCFSRLARLKAGLKTEEKCYNFAAMIVTEQVADKVQDLRSRRRTKVLDFVGFLL